MRQSWAQASALTAIWAEIVGFSAQFHILRLHFEGGQVPGAHNLFVPLLKTRCSAPSDAVAAIGRGDRTRILRNSYS
jgi:hypothetical protein